MKKVAIIDYGMGNIDSVVRAVEECGACALITSAQSVLEEVSSIILPGVGAFSDGMNALRQRGLDLILKRQVFEYKIPFLGICLGMQLLAEKGFEGGETLGLGWVEGEVKRFIADSKDTRIPHIGWNEVYYSQPGMLFEGIPAGKDFYFVHSYHLSCKNETEAIARTNYCGGFVSAIRKDNILGVQFHPEKSQRFGLRLLRNFLTL
jgi:glutamine amidotransferase